MIRRHFSVVLALLCLAGVIVRIRYSAPGFYAFYTERYSSSWIWNPERGNAEQFLTYLWPWLKAWWAGCAALNLGALLILLLPRNLKPRHPIPTRPLPSGKGDPQPLPSVLARIDAKFFWLALAAGVVLALARWGYFWGPNYSQDERAYYFQADLLSQGMLRAPTPPHSDSFQSSQVYCRDFWTSSYQVGWPAALAAGKKLGLDLWVNCLWWVVILFSLRALGRKLWGPAEGFWAGLLFLSCPGFWLLAWGDFAHLQTTALALISWLCFLNIVPTPSRSWAWLPSLPHPHPLPPSGGPSARTPAGPPPPAMPRGSSLREGGPWALGCWLSWAWLAATRFPEIVPAMLAPCLWLLAWYRTDPDGGRLIRGIGVLTAGGVLSVLVNLLLNWGQTGSPTTFAINLYLTNIWSYHNLWRGFYNLGFYVFRVSWWMPPMLLPLLFYRPRGPEWGLWAALLCHVAIYLFHFCNGCLEWGARFYTLSLTIACLLAGAGIPRFRFSSAVLVILGLTTWVCGAHTLALCSQHYVDVIGATRALDARLKQAGPSLVFVRKIPAQSEIFAFIHNRPDFTGGVYAIWLDPEINRAIRQRFPQYQAWIVDFQSPEDFRLQPFPDEDSLFSPPNYYAAGVHYLTLKQPGKALHCFRRALPSPDDGKTLALIALLERDQGESAAATKSFEKAIQLAPQVWNTRMDYADLLKQQNRSQEARLQYQAVIQGAGSASPEGQRAAQALLGL